MADSGFALPTEKEFKLFQQLIMERLGIQMAEQKRALISSRLWKRLQARGILSFHDYYDLISLPQEHNELHLALDLLTTNETYFFREHKHFDYLRDVVLPKFDDSRQLRIWSAACSSGEEPYSLAMILADKRRDAWELLASDISSTMLDKAKRAIYLDSRTDKIPDVYRRKYCLKGTGHHDGYLRICPELRAKVRFDNIGLHQPLPDDIGTFDIIFLRNVMIYFNDNMRSLVLNNMAKILSPSGYLFVSHTESLHGLKTPFRSIAPAVYTLQDGANDRA